MGKLVDSRLFELTCDFLKSYLPNLRRCSNHTVRAYQKALELLFDFVKAKKGIKLHRVTLDMLDRKTIIDFLDYLESERGCSIATRNHRLQCIQSFFSYISENDVTMTHRWLELRNLKKANTTKETVKYMSEEAVRILVAQPDTSTRKGLRDMFIMMMLYQTGARIRF
jgi:site-specific recombinase XerD